MQPAEQKNLPFEEPPLSEIPGISRMHVAGMQIDFSNPLSLAGSQFVELVLLRENGRFVL